VCHRISVKRRLALRTVHPEPAPESAGLTVKPGSALLGNEYKRDKPPEQVVQFHPDSPGTAGVAIVLAGSRAGDAE
jgi:hypothetical protein